MAEESNRNGGLTDCARECRFSFGNVVRKIDIFGHPIGLNFDYFETKRKTLCGGMSTICLVVASLLYFASNLSNIKDPDFS